MLSDSSPGLKFLSQSEADSPFSEFSQTLCGNLASRFSPNVIRAEGGWLGVGGGRGDSGLGARIHLWWIHVNVWQNQYSIVK